MLPSFPNSLDPTSLDLQCIIAHVRCRWSTDDAGNEYIVLELAKLGSLDKLLLNYGAIIRMRAKLMM